MCVQCALPQKKAMVVPRLHLPAIAALGAGASPAMPSTAACSITTVPRAPSVRARSPSFNRSPTARARLPPPLAVPGSPDGEGGEPAEWPKALDRRGLGSAASVASATPSEAGARRAVEQLTPELRAALAAAAEQVRLGPAEEIRASALARLRFSVTN